MKFFIYCNFLLALLPIIGNAQTITTYDSRFGIDPVASSYLAIDVGVTDTVKNPDFKILYRNYVAPSLIDTQYKLGVTITGTVEQAEAELAAIKQLQLPAIQREKDKDVKSAAKVAAQESASANSVPALRQQVKRLAELIEQLQERVEQLEANQ